MEYRQFGPTGIKVSVLGYGAYMFKEHFKNPEQETYETVKKALELGINFFDTAEMYAAGESEINLGKAFKKLAVKREEIVVTTKLFFGAFGMEGIPPVNGSGLSRKHVIEGMNASLKRLQLDYVDVVFCHRYDPETPLEETCRAFDWLIKNGKAFYWGTSEWTPSQIIRAIEICDKLNLERPVVEQPQYNMFFRQPIEVDLVEVYEKYGYATTTWSPLAQGFLTGKYINNDKEEGRFAHLSPQVSSTIKKRTGVAKYFAPENLEETKKKFKEIEEIGKQLGGATIAQVALAWVIRNKDVSTALIGASKVSQLEDNFKAIEFSKKFTPEIEKKLSTLFDNQPDPGMNWKTRQPNKGRRESRIE